MQFHTKSLQRPECNVSFCTDIGCLGAAQAADHETCKECQFSQRHVKDRTFIEHIQSYSLIQWKRLHSMRQLAKIQSSDSDSAGRTNPSAKHAWTKDLFLVKSTIRKKNPHTEDDGSAPNNSQTLYSKVLAQIGLSKARGKCVADARSLWAVKHLSDVTW